MNFEKHFRLEGKHAAFSPSQPSWLRYDDEKALSVFRNRQASEMGTRLHAFAKDAIDLGIKQKNSKKTLCAYINDAINYKMDTEVVLYYSDMFFGTADAISYRGNILRIHDLKTGIRPAHIEQLLIYAALFCLEYKMKPVDMKFELRLYQNDEVLCHSPEPDEVIEVMDIIRRIDKVINISEYKGD